MVIDQIDVAPVSDGVREQIVTENRAAAVVVVRHLEVRPTADVGGKSGPVVDPPEGELDRSVTAGHALPSLLFVARRVGPAWIVLGRPHALDTTTSAS